MKGPIILLICMLCLAGCASIRSSEPSIPEYAPHLYITGTDTLPYRLLEPVKPRRGKLYPLVVFLHGSGERGNDNTRQLTHGTYLFQKSENFRNYPCFVLAPQCPEGSRWVEAAWDSSVHHMPENPSKPLKMVHDLIVTLTESLPVDPGRIYVTGLSMGGFGTWDMLARWPDLFASGVPICGGGDISTAPRIAHIPVWIFHSSDDGVVPVDLSRSMALALEKAGATFRYTEYNDAGHGSWKPAYEEPELIPWLFSHKKSQSK